MRNCLAVASATLVVVLTTSSPVVAQRRASSAPSLTTQDYIDIQQLYARYAHTFDLSGDTSGDAWADVFTPDGIFRPRGSDDGMVTGHKALAAFAGAYAAGADFGTIRHWTTSLLITPTTEGATGTCYYFRVNPKASPLTVARSGVYYDELVKTAQGWKFKIRTFKPDQPATAPTVPAAK